MISNKHLLTLCALALALITALAACGGGDEPSSELDDSDRDTPSLADQAASQPDSDIPTQTTRPTESPTTPSPDSTSARTTTDAPEPETATPPPQPEEDLVESDRQALIALYEATDGPNWTRNENWLTDAPIGTWQGVTTDATGRVTELDFQPGHSPSNGMSGEIPPDLGDLSSLWFLDMSKNELSGEIPPELGSLLNLTVLDLGGNHLSGEIPAELGDLSNLEHMVLAENRLVGEIPPELGNLSNLTGLFLSFNQLTGEIPPELSNLPNLADLFLLNNQFTGQVPLEFANFRGYLDVTVNEQLCFPEALLQARPDWPSWQMC